MCGQTEYFIYAVALIGVAFGFGVYELEQKHIDSARKICEAIIPPAPKEI